VPRKGGSRPSSSTPSPHQGKARHVPPIPVGPHSAGVLPLRGSSSAAPTPLLLPEGGKVSRTGAVAGASSSGATPATLPLSGVDARSCHYFCGEDEHRTPSLPHGRGVRSAVPHCLVLHTNTAHDRYTGNTQPLQYTDCTTGQAHCTVVGMEIIQSNQI
jgi:hypothetical protein